MINSNEFIRKINKSFEASVLLIEDASEQKNRKVGFSIRYQILLQHWLLYYKICYPVAVKLKEMRTKAVNGASYSMIRAGKYFQCCLIL